MAKSKKHYCCSNCQATYPKWQGKCFSCGNFNTIKEVEEVSVDIASDSRNTLLSHSWTGEKSQAISLSSVKSAETQHIPTGISEFDRALGGGFVLGSSILLSGSPGAGKSTLLLQLAGNFSLNSENLVLYVSAEETLANLKKRAERLNVPTDNIIVYAENQVESILNTITQIKPKLVIIDSIQTLFLAELKNAAGGTTQIEMCTQVLNKQAKELNHCLMIIGHVTKDGTIAGPKKIEHIVDATLKFDEETETYRSITAVKNRYGAIETGFFEMTEKGLISVENPHGIFLSPDLKYNTSLYIMNRNNRNILVEFQSLIDEKAYNSPKRIVNGLDTNRLHALLANISFHQGYSFTENDIYAQAISGVQAKEPDADVPLIISLAITAQGKAIKIPMIGSFGEIALNGQVRGVRNAEARIKESLKFGLKHIVVPMVNKNDKLSELAKSSYQATLHYVDNIGDVLQVVESFYSAKNL